MARASGESASSTLPASNHSSNITRRFTSACISVLGNDLISSVRSRSLSSSAPERVTANSSVLSAPKDMTPGLGAFSSTIKPLVKPAVFVLSAASLSIPRSNSPSNVLGLVIISLAMLSVASTV